MCIGGRSGTLRWDIVAPVFISSIVLLYHRRIMHLIADTHSQLNLYWYPQGHRLVRGHLPAMRCLVYMTKVDFHQYSLRRLAGDQEPLDGSLPAAVL